jgi:hypothetical protein
MVTADDLDAVEADTEVRGNELSNGHVGLVVHRSCVDPHDQSAISRVGNRVSASTWDHTYLEAPVVRAHQPRP